MHICSRLQFLSGIKNAIVFYIFQGGPTVRTATVSHIRLRAARTHYAVFFIDPFDMLSLRSSLPRLRALLSQQRRFLGANNNMPRPQSMDAELWQGHPKHKEGWETTIYLTYGAATIILGITYFFSPETSIQTWAAAEAQARLDLKAKGVKPEFGRHYSDPTVKYDYDSVQPENPFNEEDEEEEDEDEDEEGDDEEEEEEDE